MFFIGEIKRWDRCASNHVMVKKIEKGIASSLKAIFKQGRSLPILTITGNAG